MKPPRGGTNLLHVLAQDAAKKREADLALATRKASEKSEVESDVSDDKPPGTTTALLVSCILHA